MTSQLTFVVTRLADGALGEAGKQAWEALAGLVRRLRRRDAEPLAVLDADPDSLGGRLDAGELAQALVREAAADPRFAAALGEWLAGAEHLVRDHDTGNVNIVSGTVHGPIVQARDIAGSLTFGDTTQSEQRS